MIHGVVAHLLIFQKLTKQNGRDGINEHDRQCNGPEDLECGIEGQCEHTQQHSHMKYKSKNQPVEPIKMILPGAELLSPE
jgi:hypothetical protein